MKYIIVLAAMLLATKANAQQVIYDPNVEVRQVGSFNAIEVSGTVMLYLSQSDTAALAVSAGDEKYNSKIKTETKEGVLSISVDGGVWNSFSLADRKLKVYVAVPDLNRMEISGASSVVVSGKLTSPALQIAMSGASEMKGNLDVERLNLTISGASEARLSGRAGEGLVEISGASKLNSYQLFVDRLKAETSGASSVRITVKESIAANASGGSTLYYRGSPTSTSNNASAGASIKQREEED